MAFLVCYSVSPPSDHAEKQAAYLDQRFYELLFVNRDRFVILRDIALLRYKSPTMVIGKDRLASLDREIAAFEDLGVAHPQIQGFRAVCAKAMTDGCALTISGDMYPELGEAAPIVISPLRIVIVSAAMGAGSGFLMAGVGLFASYLIRGAIKDVAWHSLWLMPAAMVVALPLLALLQRREMSKKYSQAKLHEAEGTGDLYQTAGKMSGVPEYTEFEQVRFSPETVCETEKGRVVARVQKSAVLRCELRRGSPEQRPLVSAVLGLVLLSPGYLLVRHVSRMAGGHWGFNPRYEFAMLFLVLVGLWLVYRATLSRRYFVLVATGQRETKLVFHPGRRVVAIREFLREAGRDYRWEIVDRSGPNR